MFARGPVACAKLQHPGNASPLPAARQAVLSLTGQQRCSKTQYAYAHAKSRSRCTGYLTVVAKYNYNSRKNGCVLKAHSFQGFFLGSRASA